MVNKNKRINEDYIVYKEHYMYEGYMYSITSACTLHVIFEPKYKSEAKITGKRSDHTHGTEHSDASSRCVSCIAHIVFSTFGHLYEGTSGIVFFRVMEKHLVLIGSHALHEKSNPTFFMASFTEVRSFGKVARCFTRGIASSYAKFFLNS